MLDNDISPITESDINNIEESLKNYTGKSDFIFDEERRNVLRALNSIDVNACPGSGKTTMIAAKLMILADKWPYRQKGICILSHTNVAKDEIIKNIKLHSNGHYFLNYPHFIGTIQDFVNTFIALPYLRSNGIYSFYIENDEYVKNAWRLLEERRFLWLKNTLKGAGDREKQESLLRETYYLIGSEEATIHLQLIPRAWKNNLAKAKDNLLRLKQALVDKGFFLFRDMYYYSDLAIKENDAICKYIQKRFPLVLFDEMQDTEVFQDDILQLIFPLGQDQLSSLQRFGDTNQAIFNRVGAIEGSNSFPNASRQKRYDIIHSHRFGINISNLTQALSIDKGSSNPPRVCMGDENSKYNYKPILISVVPGKESEVLCKFVDIIKEKLSNENLKALNLHAVAANSKKSDDALRLTTYFPTFDKIIKNIQYVSETLHIAITQYRYHVSISPINLRDLFQDVWKSLSRFLRSNGCKYVEDNHEYYYSVLSLQQAMQNCECDKYKNLLNHFRILIWNLIKSSDTEDDWSRIVSDIVSLFKKVNPSISIDSWVKSPETLPADEDISSKIQVKNIFEQDNLKVILGTIHSVKGQTHDATLVMETKYYELDWESSVKGMNFTTQPPKKPKRMSGHMRILFVGCSRPSKLLCVAVTQATAELIKKRFPDLFEEYKV